MPRPSASRGTAILRKLNTWQSFSPSVGNARARRRYAYLAAQGELPRVVEPRRVAFAWHNAADTVQLWSAVAMLPRGGACAAQLLFAVAELLESSGLGKRVFGGAVAPPGASMACALQILAFLQRSFALRQPCYRELFGGRSKAGRVGKLQTLETRSYLEQMRAWVRHFPATLPKSELQELAR